MSGPRFLFPRVGRPPRTGQPEDPRYAFIRYKVLEFAVRFPYWADGDTLLRVLLWRDPGAPPDPTDRLWIPYLQKWVRRSSNRTVVRQFDKWLEQASDYMDLRAEGRLQLPHPESMTPEEKAAAQKVVDSVMDELLDYLKLPKPPYDLPTWLNP